MINAVINPFIDLLSYLFIKPYKYEEEDSSTVSSRIKRSASFSQPLPPSKKQKKSLLEKKITLMPSSSNSMSLLSFPDEILVNIFMHSFVQDRKNLAKAHPKLDRIRQDFLITLYDAQKAYQKKIITAEKLKKEFNIDIENNTILEGYSPQTQQKFYQYFNSIIEEKKKHLSKERLNKLQNQLKNKDLFDQVVITKAFFKADCGRKQLIQAILDVFQEEDYYTSKLLEIFKFIEKIDQDVMVYEENYQKQFTIVTTLQDENSTINLCPLINHLSLANTHASFLPEEISHFQNLNSLDLSYTKIKELPESISNLQSLTKIIISKTNTDLENAICRLFPQIFIEKI